MYFFQCTLIDFFLLLLMCFLRQCLLFVYYYYFLPNAFPHYVLYMPLPTLLVKFKFHKVFLFVFVYILHLTFFAHTVFTVNCGYFLFEKALISVFLPIFLAFYAFSFTFTHISLDTLFPCMRHTCTRSRLHTPTEVMMVWGDLLPLTWWVGTSPCCLRENIGHYFSLLHTSTYIQTTTVLSLSLSHSFPFRNEHIYSH